MPIDETMLSRDEGMYPLVKAGRLCAGCGYSLTGLRVGLPCPECGKVIGPNKRTNTRDDAMTAVGFDYLSRLRWAALALAGGAVLFAVGGFASLFGAGIGGLIGLLGGLLWLVGIFTITRPKPIRAGLVVPPSEEMRRTRSIARWSQLSWPVSAVLLIAWGGTGAGAPFVVLANLSMMIGVLGLIPLSIWLSELSDWGRDHNLGRRFITSAWMIACFGFASFAGTFSAAGITVPVSGLVSILAVWAVIIGWIGLMVFLVCSLQFAALVQNAMSSASMAAGREERMRLRKLEQEQRQSDAPGEIRRPAGEPIPCRACGYDLTGLPGEAPCPECGERSTVVGHGISAPRVSPPPKIDTTPIPLNEPSSPAPIPEPKSAPAAPPAESPPAKEGVSRPADITPYDLADDESGG